MPTQALTDLLDRIKEDQNAHEIISLLHLMLHMDAERLDGGEQAPPSVCVQTEELLEQKAAAKKLGKEVERQDKELRELHHKYRLTSELNKRLYVKSKGLEAAYKKLCQQSSAAKEEQTSLILELQRRLDGLEASKEQKDGLAASEEAKEKDACRTEVGELGLQVNVADELKEQRGLLLELRQRLERLEAAGQREQVPQQAPKRSSAGEDKGKQGKTAPGKEQRRPEGEELKPLNRIKNFKEKVAACSGTGAAPKPAPADCRRARSAAPAKGPSEKPGMEKRAPADRRRPRITLDSRPGLKEAKPVKAPVNLEKKDAKLPPIHKKLPMPVRARPKDNPPPGRFCGVTVVQTSRPSFRTPVQGLQDLAKARLRKLPLLGTKPSFPHKFPGAKAPPLAAPESVEGRPLLFPVSNVDFHRDKDFSPWEHGKVVWSFSDDDEDHE